MQTVIQLNRRVTHRILSGHVWVYSTEIERVSGAAKAGDVVAVRDHTGRFLGQGIYNPASKIAVRIISWQEKPLAEDFIFQRVRAAIAYRNHVLPGRPARRLVNSEADQLPGLIVDHYDDVVVVQCTTAGMDQRLPVIIDALVQLLQPRAIIERNDITVRDYEGLPQRVGVIHGQFSGSLRVRVGDADFACDPLNPHKTGLYLDQQMSWLQVAKLVKPGAKCMDAFCHLGGFGVHALRAGAGHVVAIDSASESIRGTEQTMAWAGFADKYSTICDNAFDILKAQDARAERYDLIVLDPPSFTRSKNTVEGAMRGYKEIHLRALRMLDVGGVLATFSCSHHISATEFETMIVDAASDAKKIIRREAIYSASPDHPVLPAVPETEYLKGFAYSVIG
jgi:23S rRNA (cytosine1962-C5)-methyltransferase